MFRAENDILKLSSSSQIEMKAVGFFSIFDPFLVIFGDFGSKVTIVWVRDLGARGTRPPNFNRVSFVGPKVHIGTGMGSGPGGCWPG